jgi:polyisoprenoid-binding protein YceI
MKQTAPETSKGIRPAVVAIIVLVALGVGAGVGVLGYNAIMAGSGQASGNTPAAVTQLSLDDDATETRVPAEATTVPTEDAISNAAPTLDLPEPTEEAVETAAATVEAAATSESAAATSEATAQTAATGDFPFTRGLYRIDNTKSEVRFQLDEDLRGLRNTVIGATNEVAGDMIVDFSNPAGSELGAITVNSRTLRTDNNFRNQALRSQILRSAQDEYEFITFTPTTIGPIPSVKPGGTVTFEVTGDLHIIEITKPVTFEVTVTVDSPEQLSGTAKATVLRSDFNLNIPNVPGVANVTDEVILEIDFVAPLVESR